MAVDFVANPLLASVIDDSLTLTRFAAEAGQSRSTAAVLFILSRGCRSDDHLIRGIAGGLGRKVLFSYIELIAPRGSSRNFDCNNFLFAYKGRQLGNKDKQDGGAHRSIDIFRSGTLQGMNTLRPSPDYVGQTSSLGRPQY
jgi:hypothetical protein